jgi:hypothetical protein
MARLCIARHGGKAASAAPLGADSPMAQSRPFETTEVSTHQTDPNGYKRSPGKQAILDAPRAHLSF